MSFFDTHCHLAGEELFPVMEEKINSAVKNGVKGFAIISAEVNCLSLTHEKILEWRAQYPEVILIHSSGIHPHEASKVDEALWSKIVDYSESANAIGETGLDYHYNHSSHPVQQDIFRKHISLAKSSGKPLVIHCREAAHDIERILVEENIKQSSNPGIFHCFAETVDYAKKVLDLGFYISLSGIVTFQNAQKLRDVAAYTPLDRLLIETDSPWLAPVPHRGKRNEPAFVKDVFEMLCKIRKEERQSIEETLWQNSLKVFGIKNGN